MEKLSTKVRPKKKCKTDRKDLDERSGKGIDPMTVVKKAPDTVCCPISGRYEYPDT